MINQLRNQLIRPIFHVSHHFSCAPWMPGSGSHSELFERLLLVRQTPLPSYPWLCGYQDWQSTDHKSKGLSPDQNFPAQFLETDVKSPSHRERCPQGSVWRLQWQALMSRSLILCKGALGEGTSDKQVWG